MEGQAKIKQGEGRYLDNNYVNSMIYRRLPFAFINTDVARATILCMLEEANKAEMVSNNY